MKILLRLATLLCLATSLPAREAKPHVEAPPLEEKSAKILLDDAVDDDAIRDCLTRAGEKLLKSSDAVAMKALIAQLNKRECSVKLCAALKEKLGSVDLMARDRAAVAVVATPYKCKDCEKTHIGTASGFFISETGVLVTCYHVVDAPEDETMLVMAGDGRIARVTEVLAADRADDIAILQVEGSGFTALPLVAGAPTGAPVRVFSHPDERFYSLTEGHISRYSIFSEEGKRKTRVMTITADFAKGSSGGPVFDESGNVVGMVASTESIYYEETDAKQADLQMVLKHCTPAAAILRLIKK